jgi:hypothetical protein
MPKPEVTGQKKQEKAEKSTRKSEKSSQPVPQKLLAWDTSTNLIGDTPFYPPMQRHAALLSRATPEIRVMIARELQQTYGNRYVQRLVKSMTVQAKLTVGAVDDPYKRETDRVAEQVMSMPTPNVTNPQVTGKQPAAQRESSIEEQEDLQAKPLGPSITLLVQRGVATEAEIQTNPLIQRQSTGVEEEKPVQTVPHVQRQLPQKVEELQSKPTFQLETPQETEEGKLQTKPTILNEAPQEEDIQTAIKESDFRSTSVSGQKLLAYELTKVVQKKNQSNYIQRLIRSPYPWQGIITPPIGAKIRRSPDLTDPTNIIDKIPQGQRVKVISNTGDWLQVESRYRGPVLTGYIFNTLVDDATSHSMETSVGTTMVWSPSGPGSGTDFESWASAETETPFPPVTSTTVMNCWEAVLLAAYKSGSINWTWIHQIYVAITPVNWVSAMSKGANQIYSVPGPNVHMPQRGDIVFFNGMEHVALAAGDGSKVYTFWPPPNTPVMLGGTSDKVKVFTIEALVSWWSANIPNEPNSPSPPVVEFGAPNW